MCIREQNLVQLFKRLGTVLDAEIIFNDRGSKGFGFVTMASGVEADIALSRLHMSVVEGRLIQVNFATPKRSALALSLRQDEAARPEVTLRPEARDRPRVTPGALVQAEVRLAQAKLEVERLRQELCSRLEFEL